MNIKRNHKHSNTDENTPFYVCINGNGDYHGDSWSLDVEMCRLFIAAGADVNAQDRWAKTLLRQALFYHHKNTELVSLLQSSGARCTTRDAGETIYDMVEFDNCQVLAWLLREWSGNAKVLNFKDHDNDFEPGYTTLMRAVRNRNVEAVHLLLTTPGVDVNHTLDSGYGCGKGQRTLSLAKYHGFRRW